MEISFSSHKLNEYPAPLGKRFLAFTIDLIIFYLLVYSTIMPMFLYRVGIRVVNLSLLDNPEVFQILQYSFYLNLFLFLLYKAAFESLFGQTFGKRLMKINISGVDSFGKGLLRNLSLLFPIFGIIDLFPLVSSNQRLLEKAANTQVLYQPKFVIQMEEEI